MRFHPGTSIDRGVSDDREAWEEFVLIYQPVIYRIARRRGMQDSNAQDLVQTVLMRVAGAIDRWERKSGARFRHVAKKSILSQLSRSPRDAPVGGSNIQELMAEQPAATSEVEQELAVEYMREQCLWAAMSVR